MVKEFQSEETSGTTARRYKEYRLFQDPCADQSGYSSMVQVEEGDQLSWSSS